MMFSYYNVGTKTTSYMIDHWPFLAIEKLTLLCYIKRHQDTEDGEMTIIRLLFLLFTDLHVIKKTALEIFG